MGTRVLKSISPRLIDWFCPVCGKMVSQDDEVCPHCGVKFSPVMSPSEEEEKIAEAAKKVEEEIKEQQAEMKNVGKRKKPPVDKAADNPVVESGENNSQDMEETSMANEKTEGEKQYVPRTGTKMACVYEHLVKGDSLEGIAGDLGKKFSLDEEASKKTARMYIAQLKHRGLSIVKEKTDKGPFWKLSS